MPQAMGATAGDARHWQWAPLVMRATSLFVHGDS